MADEEWSEICHKIADRKRGNSTMPTAAHRLVSPIPLQAPKRRKLVAAPLHCCSLSPRPSHDISRSDSPRPDSVSSRPGSVSPRPGSVSPRLGSVSPRPDSVSPRFDSPHRSVSPERPWTPEHPTSNAVPVQEGE